MSRHPTEESFLKDVAGHQMTVVSENGVHRHVRFKKPSTGNMHFDLITWPGYLAYSGDMAAQEFESSDGFRFTDFWEVDSTEYTFRFIWCCYALAWGIRQYDAATSDLPTVKHE